MKKDLLNLYKHHCISKEEKKKLGYQLRNLVLYNELATFFVP